jgi:hypothetical protein
VERLGTDIGCIALPSIRLFPFMPFLVPGTIRMPHFSVKLVAAVAWAGVSLGETSSVLAQQPAPGVVTISDTQTEPITESESLPTPGDASASSSYSPSYGMAAAGMGYSQIPQGGSPIWQGKHWYGYETQELWQRPIRRPIYRVPVQYSRYWPTSYYTGVNEPAAQALPMVYQPTDTTQLGFYHQRVPQWQPRPNAIPGAPWPPNWHYTIPVGSSGYGYGSAYGYGYGHGTQGHYCPPGTDGNAQPMPTQAPAVIHPEEKAPVAPVPVPES